MKNFTQNSIKNFISLRYFFGTFLIIAFMIPATAVSQVSPQPVNLRTSGDLVILAQSGISTTGTTSIVGDIGVSPINSTAITGFGLILDSSGQFATSSLVTGKIYAPNYVVPTPTKMTTAVGDMGTAYTDAASRSADFINLHTGNLTGQTLTKGVYNWSTGVQVAAGAVTISGSSTDVWIFQIAQNLTLANGASVNLVGGAQASNIFWQVAGEVTLGTTSNFSGIILCQTQIAMQTGAEFNGKALAKTAVTLDSNNITESTLSLNDLSIGNGITIYPNPAQNYMTITNSTNVKLEQLVIYDVSGRLINTVDLRDIQLKKTIDVSKLASGVYLLQIQGDGARTTKRIIKR
jgi:hypothetical protein